MQLVYIDVETSPHVAYVWGLHQENIGVSQLIAPSRMLCAAYAINDGAPKFVSEWTCGRDKMLARLWKVLDGADAVVHFNGVSFDEKVLYREFLQAGYPPPSSFASIDLWRAAKKFRFASSKLEQVLRELGLPNKFHTDFSLWKRVLEGNKAAQREMRKYNLQDVRVLQDLYARLLPWITQHPNVALIDGVPSGCTYCGSVAVKKNGYAYTAAGKYQRYRCTACGAQVRGARSLSTTEYRRAA
jgi:RNase_H superfamily